MTTARIPTVTFTWTQTYEVREGHPILPTILLAQFAKEAGKFAEAFTFGRGLHCAEGRCKIRQSSRKASLRKEEA